MRSITSFGLAALLVAHPAIAAVYDRPLDIVYALQGGPALPYSDKVLLNYIDQVDPGVTSVVPFLLNVASPSRYDSILTSLKKRNITLVPAVGSKPDKGDIDIQRYKDIAKGYKNYTDYIRLENMQGIYEEYNTTGIQNMIDYCVSLGFKHIMLNPWPRTPGGGAVHFTNPEVDATIYQVLLDQNKNTSEPIPSKTNWYPGNQNKIDNVREFNRTIDILINYEDPPQQEVLANLEKSQAGGSTKAMQITIDQINGQYKAENLHWIPPFDKSYDPVALGTWNWIAKQLSKM